MAPGLPPRGGAPFRLLGHVLLLALLSGSAQAQRRTATIAGVVRDSLGRLIPGVDVAVAGSGLRARTDPEGAYRIVGLLPGPATLTARRLGFRPHSQQLRLEAGEERTIEIRLAASAELLSRIQVTAPREVYDSRLEGFNARSKLRVGHFVTRERLDRANSSTLSDMLREIPGVRIGSTRAATHSVRLRGATCPPLVFVDGFPATAGEFDIDIVDLKSVEGVEVYSGSASIPAEFSGPRSLDRCGVIAIWSRPARPRAPRTTTQVETVPSGAVLDTVGLYTRDRVDEPARLDSGGMTLSYPDSLYRARVSGSVVVEFVVDTTGAVEPGTVDVLASSDPLFTIAVREGLAEARFIPARAGGRRVRQLVQLPFAFVPEKTSDASR